MDEADVLPSNKHSSFSTSFPIYLFTQLEQEVPEEEPEASSEETSPNMDTKEIADDDEDEFQLGNEDLAEDDMDHDGMLSDPAPPTLAILSSNMRLLGSWDG